MNANRIFELEEAKNRRVLLMYITRVSGHRQATIAVQQSLKQLDPSVEAPIVNGFGYTYPVLEKVVHNTYMGVIKTTPKVWDYMYDNPKIVKNSQSIQKFLHKTSHDKIGRLFAKYLPDTVVCTQAFPCGMVAAYKVEKKLNTKIIGVLTDFAPHSFWINEGVDYYIVPSMDAKERFIKKGVPEDAIKIYGIPLRMNFSLQLDKKPIAKHLGLDSDKPTVLIMGGGSGLGPIKTIVKSLSKVSMDFQVIVITGMNKKIVNGMKRLIGKVQKKILLYEYANNVDELMEVADLIITKPGGLTTAECLSKGMPILIVDPLPGQEMRNTDFLIKNGIGIRIDDTSDVGEEVELLLKSPGRMATMKKAAYENSKPHAALDIAKLILERTKDSEEIPTIPNRIFEKYV